MRRPYWPLLVCTFWLGLTFACQAQRRPSAGSSLKPLAIPVDQFPDAKPEHRSHFLLDNLAPPGNIEQALLDRLQRAQQLRDTPPLLRGLLQDKNLQTLLKNQLKLKDGDIQRLLKLKPSDPEVSKLLNNPQWRKLFQDLIKETGGKPLNFNQLQNPDKLQELIGKLNLTPEKLTGLFEELTRKDAFPSNPLQGGIVEPGKITMPEGGPSMPASGGNPGAPATPTLSDRFKDFMTRNLDKLADGLQRLDMTDESQVLRDAIRQFKRAGLGPDELNLGHLSPGQLETLDRVGRWISPRSSTRWTGRA